MSSDAQLTTLIYDPSDGALGPLALRLVELGVRTGYADDLDELALLARERADEDGIGALVLPLTAAIEELPRLVKCIAQPLAIPLRTFVPVADAADEAQRDPLRCHGLEWLLATSCSDNELHCVSELASWSHDPLNLRRAPRFPVSLSARLRCETTSGPAQVHNLSRNGSFVAEHAPLETGTHLSLELAVADQVIELPGRVRWQRVVQGDRQRGRPPGMGIAFEGLSAAAELGIERLLSAAEDRIRL